jgi:trehalose synthase-fused probable maltokinase
LPARAHRRDLTADTHGALVTNLARHNPGQTDFAAVSGAVRDLDVADLATRPWCAAGREGPASARLAHAFVLDADLVLALVDLGTGGPGARVDRYVIPLALRDGVVREAVDGDGAWRALADAIAAGRTIPAMTREGPAAAPGSNGGQVDAALVCRPSPGFGDAWGAPAVEVASASEAPSEGDAAGTSTVIGDRLRLKAYRRVQSGLNPDLELTAYLSEEAGFTGVPRLAGWAEVVTRDGGVATVAMLQAFVPDADDVAERTVEFLADLIAAPGSVALEWATDVAADVGTLVAGLHAALATPPADAPDLAPRLAIHDELKAWRSDALRQLNQALDVVARVDPAAAANLARHASSISARLSRFEAVASAPMVMRIHGDLCLGRLLVADDGYRVVDFDGDLLRSLEDRRMPDSPLRDVASVLRSLDHVARDARRRVDQRAGGAVEHPRLDVDAWIERARSRFLAAYAEELRRSGAPLKLDLDLLDAFEVAREVRELSFATTERSPGSWASSEGLSWLLEHGTPS